MGSEDYRGRRVLVVGLARSGLAAMEFLLSRGAHVRVNDLKTEAEMPEVVQTLRSRGVDWILGAHPPGLTTGMDLVLVSPGVPPWATPVREARAKGIPVWGELELAFRQIEGAVVAVTGTKGKSTTATLIAEILKRAGMSAVVGGNIGRPLVEAAAEAGRATIVVVEVSSFQLEATERFRPKVAVLLNVTPDHLDWHPDFDAYVEAKRRIFANQQPDDWAVVYHGNPLTVNMANRSSSRKVYFNLDCLGGGAAPHLCLQGPWIVRHEGGETRALASSDAIRLPGRHNIENVMAASAVADIFLVGAGSIGETVAGFIGVRHALEKVGELNGVVFYDDSKATNIAAAQAAIETFGRGVFLILGGRHKAGDFRDLRRQVAQSVKRVLAIGEARATIVRALGDIVPVALCRDLSEAVQMAYRDAGPGDVVLLSPACASFDMFSDYQERGQRFCEEVAKLKNRLKMESSGGTSEDR